MSAFACTAPRQNGAPWTAVVDECWSSLVATLPTNLREPAERLAITLRLAPVPLPWSRIFHQEVTLALPLSLSLSDAIPGASDEDVRRAVTAHMLGIVAAFGADRLDDGQVAPTPELVSLLALIREARDAALDCFGESSERPIYSYRAADVATELPIYVARSPAPRSSCDCSRARRGTSNRRPAWRQRSAPIA